MKLVLQRVLGASVSINQEPISVIGSGLMVLIGIDAHDTEADLEWGVQRIIGTRLWPEHLDATDPTEEGKPWQNSVKSAGLDVLCVSQFTLCCSLKKKGGVSFHHAMRSNSAQLTYNKFLDNLRSQLPEASKLADGAFGERMRISLVNDGPVTISLDSRNGNGLASVIPSSSSDKNEDDNPEPLKTLEPMPIASNNSNGRLQEDEKIEDIQQQQKRAEG